MMLIKFTFQLTLVALIGFTFNTTSAADNLSQSNTQQLSIKVKRIKALEGEIFYQLLKCPVNAEVSWDNLEMLHSGQIQVTGKTLRFDIKIPESKLYILRLFQDLNQNQTLDFSNSEIPKEPIGFSNNPSMLAGKPKPLETCFQYQNEGEVVISMRNKQKKRRKR